MSKGNPKEGGKKPIARNRKAFHDFEVVEQVEAGIVLQGTEVKSLRAGNVNFTDAYAKVGKENDVWLLGLHIAPYSHGTVQAHEPTRKRKLLLHKREIQKLKDKTDRQGLTLVPLELYFRRGYAKVALGICRGRKRHDKRQALRKKQDQMAMARERRGR
jgi:SsrA-binding protein